MSNHDHPPGESALYYALVAVMVFVALFLGTWRPLPMMVIELAALGLLVGLLLSKRNPSAVRQSRGGWRASPLSRPAQVFLLLLFLLPLVQLLPVPLGWWAELPGRLYYAEGMHLAGAGSDSVGWRAISLIPTATEAAWLALLPPLAVFLVAVRLDQERLLTLVVFFLGVAAAEALFGLVQFGQVGDHAFGTYRNHNHLAGLLEMALPVGLALLAATVGHARPSHANHRHGRHQRTFRQWLARFSVGRINRAIALGALSLAILLGLIFTRSRSGISLAMLGILLSTLLFSYRLGGRNAYGVVGTLTAVGVGLASLIGLVPVWSRFASNDPLEDGRWKIFDATVRAIGEFFPLGSGAGTFVDVLRRFHPADFPGVTINRAHNDYLEWLLEFGILVVVLLVVWLLFYLRQWGRVWKPGDWTPFRFAQAGAGVALLMMMLHSLTDYNLRTPANAVFTAFLAAVFFHQTLTEQRRPRRQVASGNNAGTPPAVYAIPPENLHNPFGS